MIDLYLSGVAGQSGQVVKWSLSGLHASFLKGQGAKAFSPCKGHPMEAIALVALLTPLKEDIALDRTSWSIKRGL